MEASNFSFAVLLLQEYLVCKLLGFGFESVICFFQLGTADLILMDFLLGLLEFLVKGWDLLVKMLVLLADFNIVVFHFCNFLLRHDHNFLMFSFDFLFPDHDVPFTFFNYVLLFSINQLYTLSFLVELTFQFFVLFSSLYVVVYQNIPFVYQSVHLTLQFHIYFTILNHLFIYLFLYFDSLVLFGSHLFLQQWYFFNHFTRFVKLFSALPLQFTYFFW